MHSIRLLLTPALVSLFGLLAGCGSELPRQPISGTITGTANRDGTVTFQPVAEVSAPAARTALRNGEFQFDRSNGPLPGTYRVRIDVQKPPQPRDGQVIAKDVAVPESVLDQVPPETQSFYVEEVHVSDARSQELTLVVETAN
ncbi:MAG: hypothetical protein ACYTGL_12900 [Planctomycetota bacterium]